MNQCHIPKLIRMLFFVFCSVSLWAQDYQIPIWPDKVPNQLEGLPPENLEQGEILRVSKVSNPDIKVYLPSGRHATGQAVLICPGGGYAVLAYNWEGTDIARWLTAKGIAGIVLKYRLPSPEFQPMPRLAPVQDAKQAIRLIRQNAKDWNIDPNQVGVMGFSAGGHLASTLGTHYNDTESDVDGQVADISARPDFMVLMYPVISMGEDIAHMGSRSNLLGENPTTELIQAYSNELRVTPQTPPTFLVHSSDDQGVPVSNSLRFYQALLDHGVPAEMHLYPYGGHGYSLAIDDGYLKNWPNLLAEWLNSLR
jgi:acetyl esterase/lipase